MTEPTTEAGRRPGRAHTWKEWYYVRTTREMGYALRKARVMASYDHPDTPTATMMTPEIREVAEGWEVMVIGKPYVRAILAETER